MTVRTRFAPSPTGRLHLGNIRAAVFNWLFTRGRDGVFVLRLEDTDTERNVAGAEAELIADLHWLGMTWQEGPDVGGAHGPYRQSERAEIHAEAVAGLLETGAAFVCFCDEAGQGDGPGYHRYPGTCRALDPAEARGRVEGGAPHVVRFRAPERGEVEVEDAVRGAVRVAADEVDDFVLRRRDGRVTYNFAVVVDDVAMGITHVIRGAGHLSNTPRQALLFDALAATRPVFAHLPTVLDPEGGKLSKRRGATALAAYRAAGYPPEGIVNYLSLLGWSHPDELEIFTPDELAQAISLERVGASDTAYDPEKLRWVCAQHLARRPLADIVEGVRAYVDVERLALDEPKLVSLVEALRTRLAAYGDVVEHLSLVLPDDDTVAAGVAQLAEDVTEERVTSPAQVAASPAQVLGAVRAHLEALDDWVPDAIATAVRVGGKELGARGPALFHPARLATTGAETGPDLARILHVQGRETTLDRLKRAVRALERV